MRPVLLAALLVAIVVLSLASCWAIAIGPLRDPEDAFADFLDSSGRGEDQLTDPLVLSGRRVAPRVAAAIREPAMPQRRYAIAFLGCRHYRPVLPTLRQILATSSEPDYFRGDALEAIWLVAPGEGLVLAKQYSKDPTYLGKAAGEILAGRREPYCRTWWQAFTGQHD
jgi:hypothetical protein